MKKLCIPILMGWVACLAQSTATAQEFKEHISKEFSLQKTASASVMAIYNVFGAIKVEGYAGDKVIMDIDKKISAKNNEELEKGKVEFKMEFEQNGDSIIVYIAEPYDSRPNRDYHDQRHDKEIKYKYKLDFTIKVPYDINLDVSTITDGDVTVRDVAGTMSVSNVNGSIAVANAKGTTKAHTINGSVTINYLDIPPKESSYYTLNGDLRITYPASLSADLEFKSMNGNFYTDFSNFEVLPFKITKTEEKEGGGTKYRLGKNRDVRIGSGGKTFKFETMNGNVYIKKQS